MPKVLLGLAVAVFATCGPSAVGWSEFQSRVLDTTEQVRANPGFATVTALLAHVTSERDWANGIRADACYDPALRSYRRYIDLLVTAYSKIPAGGDLSDASSADLETARAALQAASAEDLTLSAAIAAATAACN